MIIILDFGGQYSQLIARRVRENNVYCEVYPYNKSIKEIKSLNPRGIILSGGPASVYEPNAPQLDPELLEQDWPILGICYGGQLIAQAFGGQVAQISHGEFGKAQLNVIQNSLIFNNLPKGSAVWMSHRDTILNVSNQLKILAHTADCPVAALQHHTKPIFALQFHPEVAHTEQGQLIISNFIQHICKATPNWTMVEFITEKQNEIRQIVGNKKVLCALSGGVDSSVAAVLTHQAIGSQLHCVFVDHGLLRHNEGDQVEAYFKQNLHIPFTRVNAQSRFLENLKGVSDPEQKRKIIGEQFIRVFEETKLELGPMPFLLQGTIYPDIIESGGGSTHTIKSHHNVGGLPEDMSFELLEPLNQLFKDEVRLVGQKLGMPNEIVMRQPFPGPGLAIRILGEITPEKISILQLADHIYREEIKRAGLDQKIWQYFAVLPNFKSVGVMGDQRTYAYSIALRAVTSVDGMTSDWAKIPYEVLEKISNRIVNEVHQVNRVVYDITTKPPSTIEWE